MSTFSLPENCKIIEATPPTVPGVATVTFDYLSFKEFSKAYLVIHVRTAAATTCVMTFNQSPLVSGVGEKALTVPLRIWSNQNTATNDTLVERTAAITYTTTAGAVTQMAVIEILPETFAEGYDVFGCTTANFAADDVVSAVYYCVPRYATRVLTSPTGLTD